MSSFLVYSESPSTPPNEIRRDFIFLPPSGYSPVDAGTILWLINGVEQTDYTVVYSVDQIVLTLGASITPPVIADIFNVYADSVLIGSTSPSGDCPVDNFTGYTPGDFRSAYPQASNYPGITDDVLDQKIVQGSIYCNKQKWGKYYCTGMGLITAHILSLEVDAGQYSPISGAGGIGGSFSLGSGGAVNSASAGSVSYSAAIDNSKGGQIDEWLKATGWGQQFLTMRSMITAPGATISKYNGIGISG